MHLVAVALEPLKEAVEAVPASTEVLVSITVVGFAFDDEVLAGFVEVAIGNIDGDVVGLAGTNEVFLAGLIDFALKGADGTVAEAEGGVGDDAAVIDFGSAAKAFAFFAGADRGVEGEEGGLGSIEAVTGSGRAETLEKGCDGLAFGV